MTRFSTWLLACACALSTPAIGDTTMTDQDQVHHLVEQMTAAFQEGHIDAVLNAYVDGAQVVFEPGNPTSGEEALRAQFTGFAAMNPEFTYIGHEVVVSGDTALHLAPWNMTATLPDGQALEQSGLSVAVMRRQPDGSWKMMIDHPYGDHMRPGK